MSFFSPQNGASVVCFTTTTDGQFFVLDSRGRLLTACYPALNWTSVLLFAAAGYRITAITANRGTYVVGVGCDSFDSAPLIRIAQLPPRAQPITSLVIHEFTMPEWLTGRALVLAAAPGLTHLAVGTTEGQMALCSGQLTSRRTTPIWRRLSTPASVGKAALTFASFAQTSVPQNASQAAQALAAHGRVTALVVSCGPTPTSPGAMLLYTPPTRAPAAAARAPAPVSPQTVFADRGVFYGGASVTSSDNSITVLVSAERSVDNYTIECSTGNATAPFTVERGGSRLNDHRKIVVSSSGHVELLLDDTSSTPGITTRALNDVVNCTVDNINITPELYFGLPTALLGGLPAQGAAISITDNRLKYGLYRGTVPHVAVVGVGVTEFGAAGSGVVLRSFWLCTSNGGLRVIKELPPRAKLRVLFDRGLFADALQLIRTNPEGFSAEDISEVHLRMGDRHFAQCEIEAAVDEYIHTIGYTEPSYVVYKLLDSGRFDLLATYLCSVHDAGHADHAHTTLLLHCYAKLGMADALGKFVRGGRNFDVSTTISVCRGAGYFNEAADLAISAHRHMEALSVLLDDLQDPIRAVEYVASLNDAAEAADAIEACGWRLCAFDPYLFARLVVKLSTRSRIAATAATAATTGTGTGTGTAIGVVDPAPAAPAHDTDLEVGAGGDADGDAASSTDLRPSRWVHLFPNADGALRGALETCVSLLGARRAGRAACEALLDVTARRWAELTSAAKRGVEAAEEAGLLPGTYASDQLARIAGMNLPELVATPLSRPSDAATAAVLLIRDAQVPISMPQAMVICRTHTFAPGMRALFERARCAGDVVQLLADETTSADNAIRALGPLLASISETAASQTAADAERAVCYSAALRIVAEDAAAAAAALAAAAAAEAGAAAAVVAAQTANDRLASLLNEILTSNGLSHRAVFAIIAGHTPPVSARGAALASRSVGLGAARAYLLAVAKSRSAETTAAAATAAAAAREISQVQQRVAGFDTFVSCRSGRCSTCHQELTMPMLVFACGHVHHKRCVGDAGHCSACAETETRLPMRARPEPNDEFDAGADYVAAYLGSGALGQFDPSVALASNELSAEASSLLCEGTAINVGNELGLDDLPTF